MKSLTTLVGLSPGLGLILVATAFPSLLREVSLDAPLMIERQAVPDPITRFNAKKQFVSNTGAHAFVAPNRAAGDQRGPCPGLNAMGKSIP